MRRRRRMVSLPSAALVLAALLLCACAGARSTTAASAPAASTAAASIPAASACGAGGAEVLANTVGAVAERIYAAEVASAETSADTRQIESDRPLLSAVESGDRAAIAKAVHTLVYSHTHIVRLRISRGSQLLADEGGPYILAPVSGSLRAHGKAIAQFVFSVQDDLGYVKLVSRFVGVPLVLRTASGQVPIEGQLSPGPATIPDHGPVSYHGVGYEAYSFKASAYPSGRLRISLLAPAPRSLSSRSCTAIKTAELGVVAQRISRRFSLSAPAFAPFVRLVHSLTHTLVYVRQGSRTVAGSTGHAPRSCPAPARFASTGSTTKSSRSPHPRPVGACACTCSSAASAVRRRGGRKFCEQRRSARLSR